MTGGLVQQALHFSLWVYLRGINTLGVWLLGRERATSRWDGGLDVTDSQGIPSYILETNMPMESPGAAEKVHLALFGRRPYHCK